jgi:hypothetical protein
MHEAIFEQLMLERGRRFAWTIVTAAGCSPAQLFGARWIGATVDGHHSGRGVRVGFFLFLEFFI